MKNFASLAALAALVLTAVAFTGCRPKAVAATPGAAAKVYAEHIMNNDYESFVRAISFTEPVPAATARAADRHHAETLRAIHKTHVDDRGGLRVISVVSETPSADNLTCDVVLAGHYNDGLVKTVNLLMVNEVDMWKIRETPYKEIWRATTSEGDTEILKVRTGHERDFIKDKNRDLHEKQFVKDINRHNGEIEVIKTLENGRRHREVIHHAPDGYIE